jgi:hypothetical protein
MRAKPFVLIKLSLPALSIKPPNKSLDTLAKALFYNLFICSEVANFGERIKYSVTLINQIIKTIL